MPTNADPKTETMPEYVRRQSIASEWKRIAFLQPEVMSSSESIDLIDNSAGPSIQRPEKFLKLSHNTESTEIEIFGTQSEHEGDEDKEGDAVVAKEKELLLELEAVLEKDTIPGIPEVHEVGSPTVLPSPSTPQEALIGFNKAQLLNKFLEDVQKVPLAESDHADFDKLVEQFSAINKITKKPEPETPEQTPEQMASQGTFCWRSNIGVKFQRDHNKKKHLGQIYHAMDPEQKLAYQKEWATKKYFKHAVEGQTESTNFTKEQTSEFEWYTMGGLVVLNGGWCWPEGVQGTKKQCAKCELLGSDWFYVHPMSELKMYKNHKHKQTEIFREAWVSWKQFFTASDGDRALLDSDIAPIEGPMSQLPPSGSPQSIDEGASGKEIKKTQATKLPTNKSAGNVEQLQPSPDKQSTFCILKEKQQLKMALQLKADYTKVNTTSSTILKQISNNTTFKKFNNEENRDELKASIENMNTFLTPFFADMLITEIGPLKEMYGNRFFAELDSLGDLKIAVDALSENNKELLRMHSGMQKPKSTKKKS